MDVILRIENKFINFHRTFHPTSIFFHPPEGAISRLCEAFCSIKKKFNRDCSGRTLVSEKFNISLFWWTKYWQAADEKIAKKSTRELRRLCIVKVAKKRVAAELIDELFLYRVCERLCSRIKSDEERKCRNSSGELMWNKDWKKVHQRLFFVLW